MVRMHALLSEGGSPVMKSTEMWVQRHIGKDSAGLGGLALSTLRAGSNILLNIFNQDWPPESATPSPGQRASPMDSWTDPAGSLGRL